jgi:hypothetical protein
LPRAERRVVGPERLKELEQPKPSLRSQDFSVQVETVAQLYPEEPPKASTSKKLALPPPRLTSKQSTKSLVLSGSKKTWGRSPHSCNYHVNILSKEEHKVVDSILRLDKLLNSKSQVLKAARNSSTSPLVTRLRALEEARSWAN